MSGLETVDLEGVEIAAVGSTSHGDHFTTDEDLRALAAADVELGDELNPPVKLGHDSGAPSVGWVENIRLNTAEAREQLRREWS